MAPRQARRRGRPAPPHHVQEAHARLRLLFACLAAAALAGCSDDDIRVTPSIDAKLGTYRGVGIGDTKATVRKRFGQPAHFDAGAGIVPVGASEDIGVAPIITPPRRDGQSSLSEHTYRYRGVTFLIQRDRVHALVVAAKGAVTQEGVGVGRPLGLVEKRYKGAGCDDATDEGGTEIFRYCQARIRGDRYILFGGDPVDSVTIATLPMR